MKPGDIVRITTLDGPKYGVVVEDERKMFMAGWVITVLVDGCVKKFIKENVYKLNGSEK